MGRLKHRLGWGLVLLVFAAVSLRAAAGGEEKLAGEDDKAVPTAVPTPQGDERGPVQVSRPAQAASSFDLPAFVVTGGGERKALARREDFMGGLDTSGGIRTSPGEFGAGKNQLEAQGGRESLESLSVTSRPVAGALRLAAGWTPGYDASGYWAQELGRSWWILDGSSFYREGGERRGGMRERPLRDASRVGLAAGWRFDAAELSLFAGADTAKRTPEPWLAGQESALSRSDGEGGLDADGRWYETDWHLRLRGGRRSTAWAGSVLNEDEGAVRLEAARVLNGRTGSTLLSAVFALENLTQTWEAGRLRNRVFWRSELESRFGAWEGMRLGVGLGLDAVGGDESGFLLGPLVHAEQRLGEGLSLRVSVESGLRISRLAGRDFREPAFVPDPTLKAGRRVADAKAGLYWRVHPSFSLGLDGAWLQGEDWHLPHSNVARVVAVDTAVRVYRRAEAGLSQQWERGPWSQSLSLRTYRGELPETGGVRVTFLPDWSAELRGRWRRKAWSLHAGLDVLGRRDAAPDGSLPLDPNFDLSAGAAWTANDVWRFHLEGRNLLGRTLEPLPFYPEAAPHLSLGAEFRF